MPFHFSIETATNTRRFTFEIAGIGAKGWAHLRLVRIDDSNPYPNIPSPCIYDPAVHDGGNHYMSQLYKARKTGDTYTLFSFFGDPYTRILLNVE